MAKKESKKVEVAPEVQATNEMVEVAPKVKATNKMVDVVIEKPKSKRGRKPKAHHTTDKAVEMKAS